MTIHLDAASRRSMDGLSPVNFDEQPTLPKWPLPTPEESARFTAWGAAESDVGNPTHPTLPGHALLNRSSKN